MLTFLKIQNLALVDQLLWEPGEGFSCITGETGAGKSVLIGAIRLVLGERADKSMIRTGEQSCTVEALFNLQADSPVHAMLEQCGLPACEDGVLTVRRILSPSATRQFINDSPSTTAFLKEVGEQLVDMHGPNDNRSLISRERQLSLLDAYGEHTDSLAAYEHVWQEWQKAIRDYQELSRAEEATELEIELLRHQIQEIEDAAFTAEEVETLEERWQRARNASKLRDASARMVLLLGGNESSLLTQFHELVKAGHDLERLDPSTESWLASLNLIDVEIRELEANLDNYAGNLSCDPAEMIALEERIGLLENLKRKYGNSFDGITAHLEQSLARLDRIEHRSERLEILRETVNELKKQVDRAAVKLRLDRKKAAPRLAADIARNLRELGFRQAVVQIELPERQEPGPHGTEDAEFLFGPNPGEPAKPLRVIASSGELARIMLAIKSALADRDSTPLLVFDEIDSNVGGEIARAVGLKMRDLGKKHQVISITHFPQVAGLAASHFLVEKAVVKNRSISRLREVDGDERVSELVRMLGGGGNVARAHAKTLLKI